MRPYEVFRGQDSLGGFGYLLFRPADFNPLRKYPLLLFLHGAAERGDSDDPEVRSEVNNSLIIVNFFHKIQNFRQISDLFSQI